MTNHQKPTSYETTRVDKKVDAEVVEISNDVDMYDTGL
jgi:hypothetical protein